ncbi:hypothetical protein Asppvi_001584 [Aspergillus pseudoviridinutans]|uniref:Uncharacterized protein n=1 Tax=Aspergillus pseudoviridinutans TaxID=1517512 RepID=A0A9P3B292_9EURO|nr:uncharacterized protein Asppvi_001584 [Aspergillus pseudoviridinutans]GIJ83067.1 hypothetical protein Asppvi_001584 [Aspergillus pseudoviridinutans]
MNVLKPSHFFRVLQGPNTSSRITGKYTNIFTAFLILTLPLAVLVAVLLFLIFHYRVTNNVVSRALIQDLAQSDHGVLYVNINPAFLMKIASLSSTVAGFLTTFAVGLAAYPLASAVLKSTRDCLPDALLSPLQYYLTLDLVENAGYMAVWRWLKFAFSKRSKETRPPPQVMTIGRIACASLIFGALVFTGDTWLHLETKPTDFTQVSPLPSEMATYSKILNSNCTSQDNTFNEQWDKPCSLNPNIRNGYFIDPIATLEVFNNVSATRSINVSARVPRPMPFWEYPVTAGLNIVTFRANITSGSGSYFHCKKYTAWWGLVNATPRFFSKHYFTDATGSQNFTGMDAPLNNLFYISFGGFMDPALGNTLRLVQNNNTGVIAQEFSGVLLSTVSGALQSSPVRYVQQRTSSILTRVPTTPLYFLVASMGLLIGLGVYLTIMELVAARTKEIEEVRARLSLQQLVADRIEPDAARTPIKDLNEIFEGRVAPTGLTKRIGIGKRDPSVGDWEFKIWDPLR